MNQISDQIYKVEEQLSSAIKNGDINALEILLHDDLLFVTPNGQTITKQIDIEGYKSGNLVVHEIESKISEMKIIGDSAVVIVINELKGNFLRQSFKGKFKYIRVWKLFETGWQVIGGSGTQI